MVGISKRELKVPFSPLPDYDYPRNLKKRIESDPDGSRWSDEVMRISKRELKDYVLRIHASSRKSAESQKEN